MGFPGGSDSKESASNAGDPGDMGSVPGVGEMVIWHHRLDGHEFEQALGVGDGWMDGGAGMLLSMWSQRVGHD